MNERDFPISIPFALSFALSACSSGGMTVDESCGQRCDLIGETSIVAAAAACHDAFDEAFDEGAFVVAMSELAECLAEAIDSAVPQLNGMLAVHPAGDLSAGFEPALAAFRHAFLCGFGEAAMEIECALLRELSASHMIGTYAFFEEMPEADLFDAAEFETPDCFAAFEVELALMPASQEATDAAAFAFASCVQDSARALAPLVCHALASEETDVELATERAISAIDAALEAGSEFCFHVASSPGGSTSVANDGLCRAELAGQLVRMVREQIILDTDDLGLVQSRCAAGAEP